jgi:cytidylate kinase
MRSIESIVHEQVGRWHSRDRDEPETAAMPVITISRETGSMAKFVARRLAEDLKMDLSGKNIINQVAKNAKVRVDVVQTLDEKGRGFIEDVLAAWQDLTNIVTDDFFKHLVHTVGVIARHGNHIIMGRGATFIIPPPQNLRLRFVAPLEKRMVSLMEEYKIPAEEALKRIRESDRQRGHFVKKYFHAEIDNPIHYDMVINGEAVTVDQAVAMIKAALDERRRKK